MVMEEKRRSIYLSPTPFQSAAMDSNGESGLVSFSPYLLLDKHFHGPSMSCLGGSHFYFWDSLVMFFRGLCCFVVKIESLRFCAVACGVSSSVADFCSISWQFLYISF